MKPFLTITLIVIVGLVYGWPPIKGKLIRRATDPRTKIAPPVPHPHGDANAGSGCMYEGTMYPEGEFRPDACRRCECRGGLLGCTSSACPPSPCVDAAQVDGMCCPQCLNGANCMGPHGEVVPVGKPFTLTEHNLKCTCMQMGYYTGSSCKPLNK